MPVDLRLEIDGLTDERVSRLLTFSAGTGTWPILGATTGSSRRGFLFGQYAVRPALWLPDLVDEVRLFVEAGSDASAEHWVIVPDALPRFRATIQLLADEVPSGFALRCAWTEDQVIREVVLDVDSLAREATAPGLRELTRYIVGSG